jgi:hypothetical protein
MRSRCRIFVGKGKEISEWGKWENSVKMDVKYDDVDWIHLSQGRLQWHVNMVMSLRVL